MPKAEKGTPKDIANRIKAKGLQKLKFYCQMCEKQCRDANGFKCHMTSESHLRQMKVFSENAKRFIDRYSREFESVYLTTLRQRHTTKRVNANNVYQEVISDKTHIHMNSTRWVTLTDFVQYLGKTGKCIVDQTERGWYVQYIERDASILSRQESQARRVEAEKAAEEAQAKRMEIQRMEAAKALDHVGGNLHVEATKMERKTAEGVSLALGSRKRPLLPKQADVQENVFGDNDEDDEEIIPNKEPPDVFPPVPSQHKRPRKDEADKGSKDKKDKGSKDKKRQESTTESSYSTKPWLYRDIVVRIISKKLANGKYFKRKAIVDRVLSDKFSAEVEVLDSSPDCRDGGDILRLDQNDLETVVPKEGQKVRILVGKDRGLKAKVVEADKKKCRATLEFSDGTFLEKVSFDDFSKLA